MPPADELARTLARLYAEQLALSPDDRYLREHADPRVIATQVKVFNWYVPLLGDCLAPNARVMDWGCRHAPDTCLLRASFGHSHCLSATDLEPPGRFSVFHQYAGLVRISECKNVLIEGVTFESTSQEASQLSMSGLWDTDGYSFGIVC